MKCDWGTRWHNHIDEAHIGWNVIGGNDCSNCSLKEPLREFISITLIASGIFGSKITTEICPPIDEKILAYQY